MFSGLFPIGSVVRLKDATKRVMIIGFCQKQIKEGEERIWDYAGCLYPEGFLDANNNMLFNHDQIEQLYALGYMEDEQFVFKKKLDALVESLHENAAD